MPLDHELPFGPSGQILHFSWWLEWPHLVIPALWGARRCPRALPAHPWLPSLLGRAFCWFGLGFFCVYSQTPLCFHHPFQPFSGEAEPDVLLSLSCGCVAERGRVLLISDHPNLAIIVFQTSLSAILMFSVQSFGLLGGLLNNAALKNLMGLFQEWSSIQTVAGTISISEKRKYCSACSLAGAEEQENFPFLSW